MLNMKCFLCVSLFFTYFAVKTNSKEASGMCIINEITHFVKNGVSVFRHASSGNYEESSPEIEALRHELFSSSSDWHTDVGNLKKDRDKVARDVRTVFNNLILGNG